MERMQRACGYRAVTVVAMSLVAMAWASFAHAGPITPGNIVVVRVGTGSGALSSAATAVFLEEYTISGTFVQSIPMPTAVLGANRRLTVSGSATSEGFVTISPNGQFLTLVGYDANPGTASVVSTTSASTNRVVCRVTATSGAIDTSTVLTSAYNSNNIRSAATDDGTRFWTSGNGNVTTGGVWYATLGGVSSLQLASNLTNARVANLFNDGTCDRLFVSSSSGSIQGISTMVPCLPTTSGQTVSSLQSFPSYAPLGTYDFFFANATTIYVADDGTAGGSPAGIQKWEFNGTFWDRTYTLATGACRGLTGYINGLGQAVLFATTTTSPNSVVTITDTGLLSVVNPLPTPVTAPTNTVFRGIRYIPITCTAPTVDSQSGNLTVCEGQPAAFSVVASGTAPFDYQWRLDGDDILGADSDTYSLAAATIADAGDYDCIITNACGDITTVPATLTVQEAPLVTLQPASQTVCLNAMAAFSIAADGSAPLSYQWRRNTIPLGNGGTISGADTDTLSISSVQPGDFASYDCVVTNPCGSDTSSPATLAEDLTDLNNNSIPDCQESLTARLALELAAGSECAQPGEPVVVQVWMRDLGAFGAAGFQAFLAFDASKLEFDSGAYTAVPFGLPVITPIVDAVTGQIDLASGIDQFIGQGPTSADSLLATLTFTAKNVTDCAGTPVTFRSHNRPSRITAVGGAPLSGLVMEDSPGVRIDGIDPIITGTPVDAIVQCNAVPSAPTTLPASDNCDLSVTQATYDGQVIAPGSCPQTYTITRSWSVTDSCGNTATTTQTILVQDTTAPIITGTPGPITAECDAIPTAPATLPASDNCDGTVTSATYQGQTSVAGTCIGSSTITRTWTATDACGNSSSVTQTITVIDTTAPVISGTPGPITAECSSIPPSLPFLPASDACDPTVTQAAFTGSTITAGSCPQSYTLTYTWTATDSCGNSSSVSQNVTVQDTTAPVIINAPSNTTMECDNVLPPALVGASDACDPSVTGATYNGEIITPGNCPGNYSIFRSWTATDSCNNSTTVTQTITVQDTIAPLFVLPCPLDAIVVNADAGGCVASATSVNAIAPNATDNCDGAPVVTGARSDFQPLNAPYPQGNTTITWTATDACSNSDICTQLVTVQPFNTLVVTVQLSPTMPASISRCITFDLYTCPSMVPVTVKSLMTFTSGLATNVSVDIPCGDYSCIIARDELHTLARRDDDDFGVSGANYVADFTGPGGTGGSDNDILTNGNLNNDGYIDILDFGVFAGQWLMGLPPSNCLTSAPHSDITGNGTVGTEDFTFIQINFLDLADDPCCVLPMNLAGGGITGPVTDIGVAELWAMGLGHLMAGDVNEDGRLNQLDIIAMLSGAQPQPVAVFEGDASDTAGTTSRRAAEGVGAPLSWFEPTNWSGGVVPNELVRVFIPRVQGLAGAGTTDAAISTGATNIASMPIGTVIDRIGAVADRVTVMPGGVLRVQRGGWLDTATLIVQSGGTLIVDDAARLTADEVIIEPGARVIWSDWSGPGGDEDEGADGR